MKLVGAMLLNGGNWDLDAFGGLFGRLREEVKHTGSLVRHIRYEGVKDGNVHVRFFGVEVDRIENIPQGMVAWDLCDGHLSILQSVDGVDSVIWQGSLKWQWLDRPSSGRETGEFRGACPLSAETQDELEFRVTGHAYMSREKNGPDDDVCLVDYDPSWPAQFDEEAEYLRGQLGDLALRIEHYGSTSIPGMPAKPVIDMLVEIPSFSTARERVIPLFNRLECEYWAWNDHMIFIKRKEFMGARTHHIHMAPEGHDLWKGLAFRDYLRTHPEDASRYAELKRELAASHRTDRERYTEAKGAFVQEVTSRALREQTAR